jgi:hypothetical protein
MPIETVGVPLLRFAVGLQCKKAMTPRWPEAKARRDIDDALAASGWAVEDDEDLSLSVSRGVAVREFVMATGHGFADYLLFVDGWPVGAKLATPHAMTGTIGLSSWLLRRGQAGEAYAATTCARVARR